MRSLVYDITNRESFEALERWFAERSRDVPESAVKVIVGNKVDKVLLTFSGAPVRAKRESHRKICVKSRLEKVLRTQLVRELYS